jgi:hypothetical protein
LFDGLNAALLPGVKKPEGTIAGRIDEVLSLLKAHGHDIPFEDPRELLFQDIRFMEVIDPTDLIPANYQFVLAWRDFYFEGD